jgi:hypothetical protein
VGPSPDVGGLSVDNGTLSGTSINGGDPQLTNTNFHFDAAAVPQLQVRMRASQATAVQLFFATAAQPGFSPARVVNASYSAQGAFQTLTFNLATQPDWNGTITGLRLDPVSGAGIQFDVDWIRGPGP